MERVHVARTLAEAHLVRGALDVEGIVAVVRGEHLVGIQGDIPWGPDTLPSVWVSRTDAPAARRLLADVLPGGSGQEPWTCRQCGEELEGQFTQCWRCQASRPY